MSPSNAIIESKIQINIQNVQPFDIFTFSPVFDSQYQTIDVIITIFNR